MSYKKINFLIIALTITFLFGCEKDDSTNNNTIVVNKEGTFKGTFTYKDANIDTTILDYVISLTKIADNKYNATSSDGAFDIEVIDSNGSLNVTDEFKDVYTNFTGTLSNTAFSFESNGNIAGNLFQTGFVGTKVTTPNPTPTEAYFIFDDTTVTCNLYSNNCGLSTGFYKNFYFEMYGVNSSIGGSLTIRTDTIPTPGVYKAVDYEEYYSQTLDPDEFVVYVSKNIFTGGYYSTGVNGTLIVTEVNGKLAFELNNVSVADFDGNIIKILSKAKGSCK